jgi:putative two-component system response regulator
MAASLAPALRVSGPRPRLESGVPLREDERRATRVLIVDDEAAICDALGRFLAKRGFQVETAGSAAAALDQLGRQPCTIMLCDIRMPGMTGLELIPHALQLDPDLAIMMLTAVGDAGTATDALSHGAMDYLTKPIDLMALEHAIEKARRKRELMLHQRQVDRLVRDEVASRTAELEREQQALRSLTVTVTETLINAMEAKNRYLRGRSHRVGELAASIADEMGLSEDTIEAVRLAGRLMDIGRIGTREEVLAKPGKLTPEEYAHVREHVRVSMEILAPLKHLGVVLDYIHDHHEHYDGAGYPRGLAGEAISLGGRVLCAADAFDAITVGRPHQRALTPDGAIAYLRQHVNTLLDPFVYEALRAVVTRGKTLPFITPVAAAG